MAEYIKLDAIMEYCQNQKDKTINCNDLARFPTADVIELSKIDKAIEEIENTENTQEHAFYDGDINIKGAFNDGMEKALEILKRHIGEDKEND